MQEQRRKSHTTASVQQLTTWPFQLYMLRLTWHARRSALSNVLLHDVPRDFTEFITPMAFDIRPSAL